MTAKKDEKVFTNFGKCFKCWNCGWYMGKRILQQRDYECANCGADMEDVK